MQEVKKAFAVAFACAALIDEGAATLTSLANSVDSEKMKKSSFRMVLTAVGDFAYTRPMDGVVVCPISALRP